MQEEQETEVRETTTQDGGTTIQKQSVERSSQVSTVVVAQRIVWFVVGLVNTIIVLRFALLLLGANQGAGFTDFIYSVSAPLVSPFVGIFGEPVYGESVFEVSSLMAIVIYTLIGWGIAKLLTLSRPQDEI